MNAINVNDIFREGNMNLKHNIPLGTLVEIDGSGGADEFHGLRLFVVGHGRDCDGEPLYNLSFNIGVYDDISELKEELQKENNSLSTTYMLSYLEGKILSGFSEESLTKIL